MRRWTLELPDAPYITPNQRGHWTARARLNRGWRHAAHMLARSEGIPPLPRIHVALTMQPKDRRRRDPDNLVPGVLKPCIDGLVDAGIVPDDGQRWVDWSRPRIVPPDRPAGWHRWWLEVTELETDDAA